MTYTHFPRLLLEALVVAVGMVVVFYVVHFAFMKAFRQAAMTHHGLLALQIAIAAALFHVIFEYTGLNEWYCVNRPRSLR